MTSCSTQTPKHNIYNAVWLLRILMIDGIYCVAILITTNASDYQHRRQNVCFYFTTKGCPIGTSFQHKLTNLHTRECSLELGTESQKQSLYCFKDNIFSCISLREHETCQKSWYSFSQSWRIHLDHKEVSENFIRKRAQILFPKKKTKREAIESLSQIRIQCIFWHCYWIFISVMNETTNEIF